MALTTKDGKPVPVPDDHWIRSWWFQAIMVGIAGLLMFNLMWDWIFDPEAFPEMDNLWRMFIPCTSAALLMNFLFGPFQRMVKRRQEEGEGS